jgi:hypothetical protein
MTPQRCRARGCRGRANWTLIPGYATNRGQHLCENHWRELNAVSSIESECYRPLDSAAAPAARRAAAS